MSTLRHQNPVTDEWAGATSPIVVGVDGSEGSTSALEWAAREAARTGASLRLVTAAEERHLPRFPLRLGHDDAVKLLDKLATTVHDIVDPELVSTQVYDGHATPALLEHLEDARMLVVGKRGMSTLPRLLVGSTSLSLAGRAEVPVAVVPTGWSCQAHTAEPVVVGVDPYRDSRRLLSLAFRRAQHLHVPLVAVHGWEAPGAPVWTDSPLDEWQRESHQTFEEVLRPWVNSFPDVEIAETTSSHHPAVAVLDTAEKGAQLVVLGRRSTHGVPGFPFGSVTRAVLHYAQVPVLVVPTPVD